MACYYVAVALAGNALMVLAMYSKLQAVKVRV